MARGNELNMGLRLKGHMLKTWPDFVALLVICVSYVLERFSPQLQVRGSIIPLEGRVQLFPTPPCLRA